MATLQEIRQRYPQYEDLSDAELAFGFYRNFYSDMPIIEFSKQIGMNQTQALDLLRFANTQGVRGMRSVETAPTVGGTAMGAARGAFQGLSMGLGDEIVAGGVAAARRLSGDERPISEIYQQELERERERIGEFRETSPAAAITSEIAGGIALPFGAARSIRQGAALGGATGAGYGFGSGEGGIENRLTGAVTGGVLGALLGGGATAAAGGITRQFEAYMTNRAARAAAEGAAGIQQLRDEANAAYEAARNAGVQIDPQEYQDLIQRITSDIAGGAGRPIRPALTPKSADVLSAMEDFAGRAVGIDDLDYLRQLAQTPAGMVTDKAEQRAASLIISGIDDFIGNLTPAQVVSNPNAARGAAEALQEARDLWGRMRRTEQIENIIRIAREGGYAGGFESGLKTQIGRIIRNPRLRRGFSDAEIALLQDIQQGTPLGRILAGISYLGFSPSGGRTPIQGGGLLTGAITGATMGGPAGAVIGAGVEALGTTGLRAIREMSLGQKADLYAQVIASGQAQNIMRQYPSLLQELQAAASAVTRGGATTLPTGLLQTPGPQ